MNSSPASTGQDSCRRAVRIVDVKQSCPVDSLEQYVCKHIDGELLNAQALLTGYALAVADSDTVTKISPTEPGPSDYSDVGERNKEIFKSACAMFKAGVSATEALAQCLERNAR
ncbi:MAG: hypothetical protein KA207_16505, partial [Burkholderiaceae bacterium]|nr:hypothetical protein [Burkholderiaceae bacterium]